MTFIIHWLDQINGWTTRLTGYAATALLASMLVIMVTHVFFRYVLRDSFGWTEELARYMMVWMTFLYFPAAHKKGMNVSLEIMTAWFKGSVAWRLLQLAIEILILIMLLWCMKLGFDRINRAGSSVSLSLGIQMAKVYWILPLAFGLTALCSLERMLRLVGSLFKPELYPVDPGLAGEPKVEH